MNLTSFQRYMLIQKHKIDVDKWCAGEKINCDPGVDYIFNWIKMNGQKFRNLYNLSKCKSCSHWKTCGYKVLTNCEDYNEI